MVLAVVAWVCLSASVALAQASRDTSKPAPPSPIPQGVPVMEQAPPMPHIHFDVVSFKPCKPGAAGSTRVDMPMDSDYIAYHCQPVYRILYFSFIGPNGFQLSGHPAWVENDLYEFEAKVAPEDIAAWQKLKVDERRVAVRDILADQLKLQLHVDTTLHPVYALTVAKGGPKLTEYKPEEQWKVPSGQVLEGRSMTWVGPTAYFQDNAMLYFVASLTAHLDRQVVDQTGLKGVYNFSLPLPHGSGTSPFADVSDDAASVAAGLAQLGLKLEATKAELDWLVLDHIERPPEN